MAVTGNYNGGAINALNQQKLHQAKGADATAQLASGRAANKASTRPSDQALAAQMESTNKVIDQAKVNAKNMSAVIQVATGALSNIRSTLTTMNSLAAQANSEDIGSKERAQIHGVMSKLREGMQTVASTTNWNGVKLLTGGAGTVSAAGAITLAGGNVTGGANTIDAGVSTESKGFISGTATAGKVTANGSNYDISLTVGDQTFNAADFTVSNAAELRLVGANSRNVIVLDLAASIAGITDVATFQTALDTAFGLAAGANNLGITSLSTAANNGLTGVTASTTAAAGDYAITYLANSNALTLQDSSGKVYEATVVAGAQSITFENGVTATLDAAFALNTAVTQYVVQVAQGSAVTLTSQTGSLSNETSTATFQGATTDILGSSTLKINAISLATRTDAAAASGAIVEALSTINTMFATLGAQQANLEALQENLSTTGENLMAAVSNYRDADIAQAITDQKIAEVMGEIANIAQGKALAQSQQLLKLAQSN